MAVEVAAVAGLLAAGVAAAGSLAAEVAAAAGSVASGSVAAWAAWVASVARAAADPGERAACAKSHDLAAGLTKDSAKLGLRVKTGRAQREHMFSALPLRADIAQCNRHVRFVEDWGTSLMKSHLHQRRSGFSRLCI